MKKVINSPILIHETSLIFSSNFIYLKSFNTVLPVPVIGFNAELNSFFVNSVGDRSYVANLCKLSVAWYTKKLKFRHKLSWFFFKRNFIKLFIFQVGKSHYISQTLRAYVIRKKRYTSSNSLIFFSINWNFLNAYCTNIKDVQSINPYTMRGLRFGRQVVYKRQGKISKYSGMKSKIF